MEILLLFAVLLLIGTLGLLVAFLMVDTLVRATVYAWRRCETRRLSRRP
jgi:hypothetical protein